MTHLVLDNCESKSFNFLEAQAYKALFTAFSFVEDKLLGYVSLHYSKWILLFLLPLESVTKIALSSKICSS